MLVFVEILLTILAVLIFIMGFKFRQGKWLRLIAGNIFNDNPIEAKSVAPYVGIVMYMANIFILITVISIWYFS
ncbi:hypothetical protein JZO82_04635 [Vagococcus fluvialis]|uniref:hypothetical protein n=1 Tax=Vagococcus fluvialis TaxID=2738 RepID=UPI001A8F47D2|nr:hypothetical protein [Vagococcus fluvialis]MBO0428441.1 hypothetical protein [Vagococcus fluvialis]